MTDELRTHLKRIQALTPKLNEAVNEDNDVVKEIEAFLSSLGAGVEAAVPCGVDERCGDKINRTFLCYTRIDSKFCIALERVVIDSTQMDKFLANTVKCRKPWLKASRDEKLDSFDSLPALLCEITKGLSVTTAEKVQSNRETREQIREALAELVPGSDQPSPEPTTIAEALKARDDAVREVKSIRRLAQMTRP